MENFVTLKEAITSNLNFFCVSEDKMEHKGGYHKQYIVHSAVCQKAPLGLKQRQTMKKSSPYQHIPSAINCSGYASPKASGS